jgi:hypothetical protein
MKLLDISEAALDAVMWPVLKLESRIIPKGTAEKYGPIKTWLQTAAHFEHWWLMLLGIWVSMTGNLIWLLVIPIAFGLAAVIDPFIWAHRAKVQVLGLADFLYGFTVNLEVIWMFGVGLVIGAIL